MGACTGNVKISEVVGIFDALLMYWRRHYDRYGSRLSAHKLLAGRSHKHCCALLVSLRVKVVHESLRNFVQALPSTFIAAKLKCHVYLY